VAAQAISTVVQEHGGVMSVEDLNNHKSTFDNPISTTYKGFRVWEMPGYYRNPSYAVN
jgi:gamma-glutamyltranspeptidase/glutathione hydrolase